MMVDNNYSKLIFRVLSMWLNHLSQTIYQLDEDILGLMLKKLEDEEEKHSMNFGYNNLYQIGEVDKESSNTEAELTLNRQISEIRPLII